MKNAFLGAVLASVLFAGAWALASNNSRFCDRPSTDFYVSYDYAEAPRFQTWGWRPFVRFPFEESRGERFRFGRFHRR